MSHRIASCLGVLALGMSGMFAAADVVQLPTQTLTNFPHPDVTPGSGHVPEQIGAGAAHYGDVAGTGKSSLERWGESSKIL